MSARCSMAEPAPALFPSARGFCCAIHGTFHVADASRRSTCLRYQPFRVPSRVVSRRLLPLAAQRNAADDERAEFVRACQPVCSRLEAMPNKPSVRDFMPTNLMDMPDGKSGAFWIFRRPAACRLRSGVAVEEVRATGVCVAAAGYSALHRVSKTDIPQADLLRACAILSAQRI